MSTTTLNDVWTSFTQAATPTFTVIKDIATEIGQSTLNTAEATGGSMLVVATATRMATQALAELAPKNKEEAELAIFGAIVSTKNAIDSLKSEVSNNDIS